VGEGGVRIRRSVSDEGDRYFLCYNLYGAEEDRRAREAIVVHLEEKISSGGERG